MLTSLFWVTCIIIETLDCVHFLLLSQIGQEYYISDGKPINNFEFFRPLVSFSIKGHAQVDNSTVQLVCVGWGAGVQVSCRKTSLVSDLLHRWVSHDRITWLHIQLCCHDVLIVSSVLIPVAYLTELVHGVIGRHVYNFQPLLTRAEASFLLCVYQH